MSDRLDIWGPSPQKKHSDRFTRAREEGLRRIASSFDALEEADDSVLPQNDDGDEEKCRLYVRLMANTLFQAAMVITVILGLTASLILWVG